MGGSDCSLCLGHVAFELIAARQSDMGENAVGIGVDRLLKCRRYPGIAHQETIQTGDVMVARGIRGC